MSWRVARTLRHSCHVRARPASPAAASLLARLTCSRRRTTWFSRAANTPRCQTTCDCTPPRQASMHCRALCQVCRSSSGAGSAAHVARASYRPTCVSNGATYVSDIVCEGACLVYVYLPSSLLASSGKPVTMRHVYALNWQGRTRGARRHKLQRTRATPSATPPPPTTQRTRRNCSTQERHQLGG